MNAAISKQWLTQLQAQIAEIIKRASRLRLSKKKLTTKEEELETCRDKIKV